MTNPTDDVLTVTQDGSVGIVTLRYGSGHEALCHASAKALLQAVHQLNTTASCRAIVLTGGSNFCPAGDFAAGADSADDVIALRGRLQKAATLYRDMRRGPKPIVAAVEGNAFGAGLALVAASDYVVAAENARFRCDALGHGLLPEAGLLWSLPEKVGDAKARELIMLGRELDAGAARKSGLVSEITPQGGALTQALAVAHRFDALPLVTVALIKAALYNGCVSIADGVRLEMDLNPLVRQAADHLEAVAAFKEKRRPSFIGN